jgi:hypothetical protein
VPDSFAAFYTAATPLARPEDITSAVVFLASDEAAYVTARDLPVDGGWMSVCGRWGGTTLVTAGLSVESDAIPQRAAE